jgi:hypothetical protein
MHQFAMIPKHCNTVDEVIALFKEKHFMFWAEYMDPFKTKLLLRSDNSNPLVHQLYLTKASPELDPAPIHGRFRLQMVSGIENFLSQITVGDDVFQELNQELQNERSPVRRLCAITIKRAFVYIDIADYSQSTNGHQALMINSLCYLLNSPVHWRSYDDNGSDGLPIMEAKLCIGDGYIFAFDNPFHAANFAANLAAIIIVEDAKERLPISLHFRIGAHYGPIFYFWDQGRNDWNYVGDGINGGNRVLSVIKDQDDVVFFSEGLVKELRKRYGSDPAASDNIFQHLINRGRRTDKHNKFWRVFELNYMEASQVPMR